ncbi:MAG: DUF2213 domain-containing protein [Thiobacillus sp.]
MKKTIQARDFMSLTSRQMTTEGYMVAPGNLARTGVQTYRAYELGLDAEGMDPMKVIRLHRPPEEVFSHASMASFESKPITVDHPSVAVTADNWAELAKGEVRDVSQSGELMTGTLLIKSKDAIEALQSGKAQLSNGYTFELDMTPGTTADGRDYDGVQRNIRGNHVALVDAARCGSACRIADSQLNLEGKTMADAKRKVTVDGIPLEVEDTAADVIGTLVKQRDEARDAVAAMKPKAAEADGLKVALDKAHADIEVMKKDVITPEARDAMVVEWAKLIGDAKRLVPDLTTDGKTCLAIRREVIGAMIAKDATAKAVADAVLAGKALDSAEPEHVRATFNALAAAVKTEAANTVVDANDADLADALTGAGNGNESKTVLTGRDKFMSRQSQAWQQ